MSFGPYRLERQQVAPRPLEEVFTFFSHPENLQAITPEWLHFRILDVTPSPLQKGSLIRYALRLHGIPVRWTSVITEWDPPHGFTDVQVTGPYKLWEHHHRFIAEGPATRIIDDVSYQLPLGSLGRLVHWLSVRRDVAGIFDFRERKIAELFR